MTVPNVWRRACLGQGEALALLALASFGPWWFALVLLASRFGWACAWASGVLQAGVAVVVYVRRRRAWDAWFDRETRGLVRELESVLGGPEDRTEDS